jgi:alpha-glucosidase
MRPLEDADVCNAKQQQTDKNSVLSYWKRMLAVRKQYNDLLVHGEYDDLDVENLDFYAFTKTWKGKKAFVICNFTDRKQKLFVPNQVGSVKRELLISSVNEPVEEELAAWEGRIYLLAN